MKKHPIFRIHEISTEGELRDFTRDVRKQVRQNMEVDSFGGIKECKVPSSENPAILVGAYVPYTNELIGYIHCSFIRVPIPKHFLDSFCFLEDDNPYILAIHDIEVKPAAQRGYVAHELLKATVSWGRELSAHTFFVGTFSTDDEVMYSLLAHHRTFYSKSFRRKKDSHKPYSYANFCIHC